jgi:outer membrane protein assembly factor BamE
MIITPRRIKQLHLIAPIIAGLLSACSVFSVHKIDVQQGNALEQKTVEQLEVGMNTEQVLYLLGNPIIDDSYHANRWDYVYYFKPGDEPAQRRKLTVFFEDGQVVRIERPQTPVETADG